ncbi:hypothetical protein [Pseudomonas fluorescens]|nr:hypothetical protein [Pseudomonas fluorescens]
MGFSRRWQLRRCGSNSKFNTVHMRRDADGNPLTVQKHWERDNPVAIL